MYSNYAYLSHHGILGQHWGKKNGPPYPLGPGDHSASERKAGWRKSLDKSVVDTKQNERNSKISGPGVMDENNKTYDVSSYSKEKKEVPAFVKKYGPKVLKTAIVVGAVAGAAYIAKKKGITVGSVARYAANKSMDRVKEAHKEFRKNVSQTPAAQAYVKTVNNAVNAVKKAPEKAAEVRREVSQTPAAQAYVKTVDKAVDTVKNLPEKAAEVRKEVSQTPEARAYVKAVDNAVEKAREVRKEVSQTPAAQAYVKAVDKAVVQPAREVRKEVASTPQAQAYVKTVNKAVQNGKNAIRRAGKNGQKRRQEISKSPVARAYVKAVDNLLGKSGKKRVRKPSQSVESYTQQLLRRNMAALGY